MAKVEVQMPDDFIAKLAKLGDQTDTILPRVVQAGGEVVLAKVKSNLRAVIGKGLKVEGRSTGELLGSLGVSRPDVSNDGIHNVKVGFNEPRRKQSAAKKKRSYYSATNAMIANVLEHGKHGQPPKPFLKPAKSASKNACIEAMKAKLDEEISMI